MLGRFTVLRVPSVLQINHFKKFSSIASRIPSGYVQAKPKPDDLVIIAMSSGVDSSVAAALYSKEYKNCMGIFMENWSQLDNEKCLEQDWKDVKIVAGQLKLPVERINFEKEYWIDVFEPMIESYSKGYTPNPDIDCNRYVKFGKLVEYVSKKYADKNWWLVTGHYSRILQNQETGDFHLMRAYHKPKDQSYYLSQINPSIINRILFPIGHYSKPEIRDIAKDLDLSVADKPDSQGLCFVSQTHKHFDTFLKNFIKESPGNIITEDGKVWAKHEGLWSLTIGQRARVQMPQGDPNYQGIWFVSDKNFKTNEIKIVRGSCNEKLFKKIIYVKDFVSLDPRVDIVQKASQLNIQYKSLQDPIKLESLTKKGTNELIFQLEERQRAIAPGQYLALYDGDRCLGSGIIEGSE